MKTSAPRRLRSGAVALVAVALGSATLVSAPAQADPTTVPVTMADIAPDESTYEGWHQGQAGGEQNYAVTSDGLTLHGKAQVINGYANSTQTLDAKNALLDDVLQDASFEVTDGQIFFQVPVFFRSEGSAEVKFTTLRPAVAADEGTHEIDLTDTWVSSRGVSTGIVANQGYELNDILNEFDDYKTLAFGVFVDTGATGSVESITWDDTTYEFQADAPEQVTVAERDIAGVENDETYSQWHQGVADAAYRHQVGDDGLELIGKSQIIKGYDETPENVEAKNVDLLFAARDAAYTVGSGQVWFQIPVFYDNGSGVEFTTLRPATGATEGEHAIGSGDDWVTSRAISGTSFGANGSGTFRELVQALGSYRTLGFGFHHEAADATGVISSVTWDGTTYTFEADAPQTESVSVQNADIAGVENDDTYTQWHQGHSAADANPNRQSPSLNHQVMANGLTLHGDSQVIKGFADDEDVDLGRAVRSAGYTVADGPVWLQLPIFFGDDESFTTLRPAAPVDEGSHEIDLTDEWMSSRALGSIAANTARPLHVLLQEAGDITPLAVGVLHDGAGQGTVEDLTFNGVTYSFDQTPAEESVTIHENDIVDYAAGEVDGEYDTWHQGNIAAIDGQAVTNDGLELRGTSQVIKGYENNSVDLDVKNADIAQAVRNSRYTVAGGEVWFQIPMYVRVRNEDNVAVNGFTTLRPATAAGEGTHDINLDDEWVSSRPLGEVVPANTPVKLKTILSQLLDYKVLGHGFFAQGGDPSTVSSVTWDGVETTFGPNRAPQAEDVSATVRANGPSTDRSVEVALDADDPDDNKLAHEVPDTVEGGELSDVVDGTVTFTPAAGFVGQSTFDYTVDDGRGGSDTATVTVDVTNAAPVAKDATGSTHAWWFAGRSPEQAIVDLEAEDADDGDVLAFSAEEDQADGTVEVHDDELRYKPNKKASGTKKVTYTVTDEAGETDTGTVAITVAKRNAVVSRATSRTLPSKMTYVTGQVRPDHPSARSSATSGQAVIVTRGGKEIGRGRVIDGKIVDRINRKTRPGILIGKNFRKGASFGVTLVYPGTSTVEAKSVRVQVDIPK
ncbi:Ig-like domain-containing protein [Aeromicrobium sp. CTD01-1L150]|uniref:Ig-like domain-containing protein n=1 Tax=Aeromicrobium sp. CTD01-1L150 TaxID=3341830 RepID=UPI0035C08D34